MPPRRSSRRGRTAVDADRTPSKHDEPGSPNGEPRAEKLNSVHGDPGSTLNELSPEPAFEEPNSPRAGDGSDDGFPSPKHSSAEEDEEEATESDSDGDRDYSRGGKPSRGRKGRRGRGGRVGGASRQRRRIPDSEDESSAPEGELVEAAEPPSDVYKIQAYPQDSRNTRVYTGPLRKWDRYRTLVEILCGRDVEAIAILNKLRWRWKDYPVLPRRTPRQDQHPAVEEDGNDLVDDYNSGYVLPSPWLPANFEADQIKAHRNWFQRWHAPAHGGRQAQKTHAMLPIDVKTFMPKANGELITLLGPASSQQQVNFRAGQCKPLRASGLPALGDDEGTSGWMLDVGGIVLSMAWAPRTGCVDQILALAAIPYDDQDLQKPNLRQHENYKGDIKSGSIQLWKVSLGGRDNPRASPHLDRVYCFSWGRPRLLQWCPVPLVAIDGQPMPTSGLLAVLTGDGLVRIIEVKETTEDSRQYEYVDRPAATLGSLDEYNVTVTCLSWIGINRIALGHSDGSITVWSIFPQMLLQRVPVYNTQILEISSGYPSYPYMVASQPVGGLSRLIDLTRPSSEHTFHQNIVLRFQPGLLLWNDHMQGFATSAPANGPLNTNLDISHVRFYPVPRLFFPGYAAAPPTCLSVGATHPYALVGRADGSLWACNMLRKVFMNRGDIAYKIKVFDSEYRPQPGGSLHGKSVRGAVRILQGFEPEKNGNPSVAYLRKARATVAAGGDANTQVKEEEDSGEIESDGPDEADEADEAEDGPSSDVEREPGQTVVHEPLTRVTTVSWNPNLECGWWAAASLASGLVRIMELGVE